MIDENCLDPTPTSPAPQVAPFQGTQRMPRWVLGQFMHRSHFDGQKNEANNELPPIMEFYNIIIMVKYGKCLSQFSMIQTPTILFVNS